MWNMASPPAALALHDFASAPDCWVGTRGTNCHAVLNSPHLAGKWGSEKLNDQLRLKGGGGGSLQEWLPPAFKRLPLMTRWVIAFQCILFVLGHLVPEHPILGAGGGAINSLGLNPVSLSPIV